MSKVLDLIDLVEESGWTRKQGPTLEEIRLIDSPEWSNLKDEVRSLEADRNILGILQLALKDLTEE